MRKKSGRGQSGQIIAISALAIALIMTSTAIYFYELSGSIDETALYSLGDFVRSIELGSRHVVIGALANITNGGENQMLTVNLNNWRVTVGRWYSFGTLALNYTLHDVAPYTSGLYISWGAEGSGVSEACVSFMLNASGKEVKMRFPYFVNVSSKLFVEGSLTPATPLTKRVTVICKLFNEGQHALAKNLTVYYRMLGLWVEPNVVNDYVVVDYGNGTYRATFVVETLASFLDVSVHVFDLRDIFVRANATCTQQ